MSRNVRSVQVQLMSEECDIFYCDIKQLNSASSLERCVKGCGLASWKMTLVLYQTLGNDIKGKHTNFTMLQHCWQKVQICNTYTIISIFILQLRATAPNIVRTNKTRDVMAARTFQFEKRTEYCRGARRCLERCTMFAKHQNRCLTQADEKNCTLIFLHTSETMIGKIFLCTNKQFNM
jgi:hypothetical protein